MTDVVRVLNDAGIAQVRAYLATLRAGQSGAVPFGLLSDPSTSEEILPSVDIERTPRGKTFADRYGFGVYLRDRLAPLVARNISLDYRLWTWLALYYFDQLCPADAADARAVFADEAYVLDRRFSFDGYYRHLVRTPWLVVSEHGERSRVLLIPASTGGANPLSKRGEIIEQLAARQTILGSPSIIEGAYRMYFDEEKGKPKRGSGGSGGGSPRRLGLIVQQLELTYDLRACSADEVLTLLPKEFDKFKKSGSAVP